MKTKVTLTINEALYKKAERLARILNRNVTDVLADAIQLEAVAADIEEDPEVSRERSVFLELHPRLFELYPGEYIAMRGGEVVDHDANRISPFARIEENYPDRFVLIRQVNPQPEIEYQFRAPRLEG